MILTNKDKLLYNLYTYLFKNIGLIDWAVSRIAMAENVLTVASWNVAGGLEAGTPGADKRARLVLGLQPDILFFPEATSGARGLDTVAKAILGKIGVVTEIDYDDSDGRSDSHTLVALAGPGFELEKIRLGERSAVLYMTETNKGPLAVVGYHAYDRSFRSSRGAHEPKRVSQARELLGILSARGIDQAVVTGDLNAMHRRGGWSTVLRAAGPFADLLPSGEPHEPQSRLARVGSLAQRLSAMAEGDSLEVFGEAGFMDADPSHRATMAAGPIRVQLDHILTRGVTASHFKNVNPAGLSDHSVVVARVEV